MNIAKVNIQILQLWIKSAIIVFKTEASKGMSTVRNRLKELMAREGITQDRLSEATGIPQSTLSRWVGNKVDSYRSDILAKLCDYFQCGIEDILAYSETQEVK